MLEGILWYVVFSMFLCYVAFSMFLLFVLLVIIKGGKEE